jgi:hypothetical protein
VKTPPPPITSPFAPDLAQVRAWLEKMVAALKFVELVTAILVDLTPGNWASDSVFL